MKNRTLSSPIYMLSLMALFLGASAANATTGYICEAVTEEQNSGSQSYSLNYNLEANEVEVWVTDSSAVYGKLAVSSLTDGDSGKLLAKGYADHAFPAPGYDLSIFVPSSESVESFSTPFISSVRGSSVSEAIYTCVRANRELSYPRVISSAPPGAMY